MGMSVVGAASSMRAFNYACSSAINPIEHWVMKSLFPNINTSTSITLGLGQLLLDGETLEIFQSNGYTVIKVLSNDTRFLVIDPETGIVRDIMISEYGWINGAYCYYNLQTNMAIDLGTNLMNYEQS
ncbi:MAG: hypothetical protein A4E25_00135 [Methanobacterium sp. PtaB.Bin024]|jgi:hypothetical protein|nr:MAG: hypothetical protein A4E25_00135 [Methanobacterium sp. PtaB.Bin024]